MFKRLIHTSLAFLTLTPSFVSAQANVKANDCQGIGCVSTLISKTADTLTSLVGGLAVLFVVIGGIMYVTSSGNPQRTDTAKKTLTYAFLGVAAVLFAKIVLNIVPKIFK